MRVSGILCYFPRWPSGYVLRSGYRQITTGSSYWSPTISGGSINAKTSAGPSILRGIQEAPWIRGAHHQSRRDCKAVSTGHPNNTEVSGATFKQIRRSMGAASFSSSQASVTHLWWRFALVANTCKSRKPSTILEPAVTPQPTNWRCIRKQHCCTLELWSTKIYDHRRNRWTIYYGDHYMAQNQRKRCGLEKTASGRPHCSHDA